MIYPYRCSDCGKMYDVWQSLKEYVREKVVPNCCGQAAIRIFTVPLVAPDIQKPFISPLDGTIINSRNDLKEHMNRNGVVLYDDIAPDIPRRREEIAAKAVADIKSDVNEAITKVLQGYVPAQSSVGETQQGIDVVNTHSLPQESKNAAVVDV